MVSYVSEHVPSMVFSQNFKLAIYLLAEIQGYYIELKKSDYVMNSLVPTSSLYNVYCQLQGKLCLSMKIGIAIG